MILICNTMYEVTIAHPKRKQAIRRHNDFAYMTFTLVYCGGSCVDNDGHEIGGGVWTHAGDNYTAAKRRWCAEGGSPAAFLYYQRDFYNLRIVHIRKLKRRMWDPMPVHGGPDPDRVMLRPTDLSDLTISRLWRRQLRRGNYAAASVLGDLA